MYKNAFLDFIYFLNKRKFAEKDRRVRRERNGTYKLLSGPGLSGYAEWKSEVSSSACSSSVAGNHENSSSVFS